MKILTFIGSYRRNGNTAQIVKAVNQHLSEVAAVQNVPLEIETIYLGAPEVQACRGCRICFNLGEEHCPIHDAFLTIKEKMRAADGIVIASPVYVDDVNGLTKNWIDRLAHVCHRPEFAGKCASLIVTVGSAYSAHSLGTLNLALSTWGFHITSKDSFTMGALMKPEQAQVAFAQRTKKIAVKLFTAIQTKAYLRPNFLSLLMFQIYQHVWQSAAFSGTYDQRYWQDQDWFSTRKSYYIPVESRPLQAGLARVAGSIIAKFVA